MNEYQLILIGAIAIIVIVINFFVKKYEIDKKKLQKAALILFFIWLAVLLIYKLFS